MRNLLQEIGSSARTTMTIEAGKWPTNLMRAEENGPDEWKV